MTSLQLCPFPGLSMDDEQDDKVQERMLGQCRCSLSTVASQYYLNFRSFENNKTQLVVFSLSFIAKTVNHQLTNKQCLTSGKSKYFLLPFIFMTYYLTVQPNRSTSACVIAFYENVKTSAIVVRTNLCHIESCDIIFHKADKIAKLKDINRYG